MANNIPRTSTFTLKRIIENLGSIPDKGFSDETPKLSTEDKQKLMRMASMYENYGKSISNEEAIVNSAKCLSELCELAEAYAVNECGDWFQQDQVKKDMKEVKKRVMEYNKVAKECYARMQQLGCSYQDIGHLLGRYYDLKGNKSDKVQSTQVTGKQPLQNEDINRVCGWCNKPLGTKAGNPEQDGETTTGICDDCYAKFMKDADLPDSAQKKP